jgi:hypothetical protein
MKAGTLILAVTLLYLSGAATPQLQAQYGSPVTVYDRRDTNGSSQGFDVGVYRNDRGDLSSLGNDKASSVRVDRGYRVRLCENEGYGTNGSGRCEEYGPGTYNLRYDNTASFIRVTRQSGGGGGGGISRGVVTVYDDRDYDGAWQTFDVGRHRFNQGEFGRLRNDEASSIIISSGYRVRLCESEGVDGRGSGRCEDLTAGRHNLRLNDEVSFIQVRRTGGGGWDDDNNGNRGGVVLYDDRYQRGNQQAFETGTYRNDRGELGQIGNDKATSVFVPQGYRVRLCENDGNNYGSGRCEEYGAGSYNLRYNDAASFVRVWRTNR